MVIDGENDPWLKNYVDSSVKHGNPISGVL